MGYDPFVAGPLRIETRTFELLERSRSRRFPAEVWRPEGSGVYPLILFSHPAGMHRRTATFLCNHLASHGYIVAAMNHSEAVVPELGRQEHETEEHKLARWDAILTRRLRDIRLLLDHIVEEGAALAIDAEKIGIAGHSLGGWASLAINERDSRFKAVVALAPGGASNPRPGILPGKLTFKWGKNIPTLY